MEKVNILIVEDNHIVAVDLKKRIINLDYSIFNMVDSGEAALNAI